MDDLNEYDYVDTSQYLAVETAAEVDAVPVPSNVSTADIAASAERIRQEYGYANDTGGRFLGNPSAASQRIIQEHADASGFAVNDTEAVPGSPDYSRTTDLIQLTRELGQAAVDITGNVAKIVPGVRQKLRDIGLVIPGITNTSGSASSAPQGGVAGAAAQLGQLLPVLLLVGGAYLVLKGR